MITTTGIPTVKMSHLAALSIMDKYRWQTKRQVKTLHSVSFVGKITTKEESTYIQKSIRKL